MALHAKCYDEATATTAKERNVEILCSQYFVRASRFIWPILEERLSHFNDCAVDTTTPTTPIHFQPLVPRRLLFGSPPSFCSIGTRRLFIMTSPPLNLSEFEAALDVEEFSLLSRPPSSWSRHSSVGRLDGALARGEDFDHSFCCSVVHASGWFGLFY